MPTKVIPHASSEKSRCPFLKPLLPPDATRRGPPNQHCAGAIFTLRLRAAYFWTTNPRPLVRERFPRGSGVTANLRLLR
jgi:hypothetical protein